MPDGYEITQTADGIIIFDCDRIVENKLGVKGIGVNAESQDENDEDDTKTSKYFFSHSPLEAESHEGFKPFCVIARRPRLILAAMTQDLPFCFQLKILNNPRNFHLRFFDFVFTNPDESDRFLHLQS